MPVQVNVTAADEDTASIVDIALIHKRKGHNPRKTRSKSRMDDMRESIRAQGVLQPVLLRPHPTLAGAYELVAGETRLDLSVEVGRSTIPALVRVISDDELLLFASIENVMRQDMGPVDEGNAAKELLAQQKTKDEVCKLLGWSRSKLDARIQITHCVDPVAQALCDGALSIGHAQLLSGLRPESQVAALTAITEQGLSVEALKGHIESMALNLAAAIFDTADCAGCPHNSSVQASLFDAGVADGRCLNKACFDDKVQAQLQIIRADLEESCNTVALDTEVASGTTAIIASTGPFGVGSDQVGACIRCQHYGALVGSQVGNEGRVTRNVCFNTVCHSDKAEAYRSLVDTEAAVGPVADSAESAPSSSKTKGKKSPAKKPKAASDATPKAILERHHAVRRSAASKVAMGEQRLAQILSILSLLADSGVAFKSAPNGWPDSLTGSGRAKAAEVLDRMHDDELNDLQRSLAAKVLMEATKFGAGSNGSDTFGSVAEWVVKARQCDLTECFEVDADYLKPYTKPVIEEILVESGFARAYDEGHGDKEFKRMVSGKKADILAAVSEADFTFKGYLPPGLKAE